MSTRGRLFVGTSGFAYKTWKPDFYPKELKAADMLRFYAERLSTVEINATFYRMPTPKLLASWLDETPEGFVFTLKASQRITHVKRLKNAEEPLAFFLDSARTLGSRLGCILFQCPPNLRYREEVLADFLAALPDEGFRFAMEFRHESWNDDAVRSALAARGVAFAFADGEAGAETAVPVSLPPRAGRAGGRPFVYLRLRRGGYDDETLGRWGDEIRSALDGGIDAFVYMKHEDEPTAPRDAERIRAKVERSR